MKAVKGFLILDSLHYGGFFYSEKCTASLAWQFIDVWSRYEPPTDKRRSPGNIRTPARRPGRGGTIGLERSFHGRPAGFRTHALVCLASSLLMMVTFYQ